MKMKKKAESDPKSDEFTRFEELAKKLVSVPKKDIQDKEKEKKRTRKRVAP
jgi:hypothetical protein